MRAGHLYSHAAGRHGRLRHLFRTGGPDGMPRGICGEPIVLRDDALLPVHSECRLVALTELSLALDGLGLSDLAVRVAGHASDISYETRRAQSDVGGSPI